jgi:hypothetical protein
MQHISTSAALAEALTPQLQEVPLVATAQASVREDEQADRDNLGLEWCTQRLLRLSCKAALLITMNVLMDVLIDQEELKQKLMEEAGVVCEAAGLLVHQVGSSSAGGSVMMCCAVLCNCLP